MDRLGELVESWDEREPKMWVWAHEGMWDRAWDALRDAKFVAFSVAAVHPEMEERVENAHRDMLAAQRLFEAVDRLRDEAYEAR